MSLTADSINTLGSKIAKSSANPKENKTMIAKRYTIHDQIGEGNFGTVFRGVDVVTNTHIAVKSYRYKDELNTREANILKRLNHRNVITLIEFVECSEDTFLILPLMNQSLYDEIYDRNYKYTRQRTRDVTYMILAGLKHIHENGIIHRDIKPENILVDCKGCVKISDFGLAVELKPGQYLTEAYGSKFYMAPETCVNSGYNQAVDIWATGVILAELKLQRVLTRGPHLNQLHNILDLFKIRIYETWDDGNKKIRYCKSSALSDALYDEPDFFDLLRRLVDLCPWCRPTAARALTNKYFTA